MRAFSGLIMLVAGLLAGAAGATTYPAETELAGQVISIADGDTLTLLDSDHARIKVRLAEIDTPEKNQPYGQRAKQELARLTFKRPARITIIDMDRYGRVVARVNVDGLDVNAEMVRRGAAWVYRRYLRRPELIALEAEARDSRTGLWALPEADRLPPWQWRQAEREAAFTR